MDIVLGVIFTAIGYCLGSVPFALLISKYILKKDYKNTNLRNYAKTYGVKWAIIVGLLDFLKPFISMTLAMCFTPTSVSYAGLAACVGHCFPLFIDFKGNKPTTCSFGFILGLVLYTESDIIFTLIYPVLFYIAILAFFRYESIAAISYILITTVIAFITNENRLIAVEILIIALLLIYKYRTNIYYLINKKEQKIEFIK